MTMARLAFNSGDLRAVARFYTTDARIDGEGGIVVQGGPNGD